MERASEGMKSRSSTSLWTVQHEETLCDDRFSARSRRPLRRGLCFCLERDSLRGVDAFHIILSILPPSSFFILRCLHSPSFLPFQKQQSIHCLNVALSLPLPLPTASRTDDGEAARSLVRPSVRQVLNDDDEEEVVASSLAHGTEEGGESDHETSKRSS